MRNGSQKKKKEKGRKRGRKQKVSEREFLREKGEPKKRKGGELTKKRGEKKRKEGRKKRREEERRFKEFDVDRTIKPGPIDIKFCKTFYSTPETTEWSPIEISMVGFS